jgi:hypothetical protein
VALEGRLVIPDDKVGDRLKEAMMGFERSGISFEIERRA